MVFLTLRTQAEESRVIVIDYVSRNRLQSSIHFFQKFMFHFQGAAAITTDHMVVLAGGNLINQMSTMCLCRLYKTIIG